MGNTAVINIKLAANLADFIKGMDAAQRELTKVAKKMEDTGKTMTKYLSAPLAIVSGLALKAAGDFERYENALKTISKSQKDFNEQYANLKQIAKLPGINIEEAIKGSIQLQAVGMSARQAERAMRGFSNEVAKGGGGSEAFAGVMKQFTQMQSKGKIMQQDVTIIMEHMPTMAALMQKAFGTTNLEIIRATVSAKDFVAKLAEVANQGPRVSGGISNAFENMQFTIKGVLATLGDAMNKNFNITGLLDKASEALERFAEWFKNLSPAMQKVIFMVGGLVAAIGPLLIGLGFLVTNVIPLLRTGLLTISGIFSTMTLTIVGAIAAVAAIAYAARLIVANWGVIKDFFARLWQEVILSFAGFMGKIQGGFNSLMESMGIGLKSSHTEWTNMANGAKKALGSIPVTTFEGVMDGMASTVSSDMQKVKGWFNSTTESVQAFGGASSKAAKQAGEAVGKMAAMTSLKSLDLTGNGVKKEEKRDRGQLELSRRISVPMETLDVPTSPMDNTFVSLGAKLEAFAQKYKDTFRFMIRGVQDVVQSGQNLTQQLFSNSNQNLDNYYQKEQDRINGSAMNQEAKAKAMAKLDEEMAKKKRALARKQAIAEKFYAIFSATISTAQGVAKALGEGGPIAGPILAAMMGALGAAQIAAIASAPLPALANGGLAFGETTAIVGDNPRAAVDPEVVAPLSKLNGMLGGLGQQIVVEVRGIFNGRDIYLAGKSYERTQLRGGA